MIKSLTLVWFNPNFSKKILLFCSRLETFVYLFLKVYLSLCFIAENLIPENIAQGVNIAGVIGSLAGGGGDIKVEYKEFSATSSAQTRYHNLGKLPDIIIVGTNTYTTGTLVYVVAFSKAMINKFGVSTQIVANSSGSLFKLTTTSGVESTGGYGLSHATETSFKVGNIYNFPNNSSCWYIAIAGLT